MGLAGPDPQKSSNLRRPRPWNDACFGVAHSRLPTSRSLPMNRSRTVLASFAAVTLAFALLGPRAHADANRDIIQELDENGVDAPALDRRLTKVTTILVKADNRLDALLSALPPGPTLPPGAMCQD